MTELFRRLVLRELRDADRLRGETEEMLLSWRYSGFSVHATEPILPGDTDRQEHLARYITRAPLRLDAVEFATLEWVDWFNNRRLLEPIGSIPPAEAEARFHADLEVTDIAA